MAVRSNIKSGVKAMLSVLAFTVVILLLLFGLSSANRSMDKRMVEAVQRSILDGAVLCYSVEGAYPESVEYLVENYGIKYDETRYVVHYQYFAANIRPDVVIIEKG